LEGFGQRSAARIASGLERIGAKDTDRTPAADVVDLALELCQRLEALDAVERAEPAGSLRRMRETLGDLDVLVATTAPAEAAEAVRGDRDLVAEVLADGDTKLSVRTRGPGIQLDVRLVEPEAWGAALVYFTGSKAHNVRLRERAVGDGLTVNEYAVADRETGRRRAGASEEEVYAALGLAWVPPPMREDTGEIEAAAEGSLPAVVAEEAVVGDLHGHCDVSGDSRASLEAMVAAAAERGLAWWAVTDHAEDLTMNGASREELLTRREALPGLAERYGLALLDGLELNIDGEGGVDYDPAFLATFDWCVASIHTMLDRDGAAQTARICTAMANPHVHAIGHPTGRLLGQRPGYDLDWERVIATAVDTGTALEVNGSLRRLDMPAEVVGRAVQAGATLSLASDAHAPGDLRNLVWAARTAQRGWAPASAVLNTRSLEEVRAFVAAKRERVG
ncbi:MAG: PHP domain-containing protein, partial [Actinomycetota bacterium]